MNPRLIAVGAILACLVAAVAYHSVRVSGLEVRVAAESAARSAAESKLSARISAEAQAVAAAVSKARQEERDGQIQITKDYHELQQTAAASSVALRDARQRLYNYARKPAPSSSGGHLPQAPGLADGVAGASADGLSDRDRIFIDRLSEIGAQANNAARQRNFVVQQYQLHCGK